MPTHDSSRGRRIAAVLIGLVLSTTDLASAASLHAVSTAAHIEEASHSLAIDWDGMVARVESTQVLVNTGRNTEEALYTFDLPAAAAVTGVSVEIDGHAKTVVAPVAAEAALHFAPGTAELHQKGAAPDVALLRLLGRSSDPSGEELARYELRVYPLPAGKAVTVRTTWVAPLRYHDGRLSLRIPARGDDANLVNQKIDLTLRPPVTARRLGAVYGDGKLLAARAGKGPTRLRFAGRLHGDLVIEAIPEFDSYATPHQARAVASFTTVPITKRFGVLAVSLLAPPPRGNAQLDFERVVVVADVSRSMGPAERAATSTMTEAVLAALPAATRVELVTFDRTARAAFPGFRDNDTATRQAVTAALASAARGDNGSDLGAALDVTRQLIASARQSLRPGEGIERYVRAANLIVLVSDGMVPLELDGGRAADHLGTLLDQCEVAAITIVPDQAPAPDDDDGVLPSLAARTHGRAISVRAGAVAARQSSIAAEIARPLPLRATRVEVAKQTTVAEDDLILPERLDAGGGLVQLGWYHGAAPVRLVLQAEADSGPVRISAVRDRGLIEHSALALAVVRAEVELSAIRPTGEDQESTALTERARRTPVVTSFGSLVALDSRDGFARDRLAMMKKWDSTTYFRLPPPPELEAGHRFEPYQTAMWSSASAAAPSSAHYRRTGELDQAIIGRLIERHVLPKAKACYDRALRQHPRMTGSLVVVIEIARGEVQFAETVESTFAGSGIEACVTNAAYSIPVPRVALGDDPETIGVARYPLAFRPRGQHGAVEHVTDHTNGQVDIDLDQPLGDLP